MDGTRNVILGALSDEARTAIVDAGDPFAFTQSDVLLEQGEEIPEVFFPTSGVVSIVTLLEDGISVENAVVGREGFVGVPLALEASRLPAQAVCQVSGEAVRVEAERFREIYRSRDEVAVTIRRYVQARLSMVMQTVACNRLHSVEQRAARWLLQVFDRAETEELNLTQEFLSHMLGVRRASVTEVARRLQAEGSIDYRRGRVQIVDVAKLRLRACECYVAIADEFARLLPMPGQTAEVRSLPRRTAG